jgi:hypothetical protein
MTLERIKALGAIMSTALTGFLVVWWLYAAYDRLGAKPEIDTAGNVVLDQFQRSKDILTIVLPLFSASLAYWVGSQGTTDAKKDAKDAQTQLNAILGSAPGDVLATARATYPEAFGLPGNQ